MPQHRIPLSFAIATEADAAAIAALLNAAADHLTSLHGCGHWSHQTTERGVLLGITPPVAGVRRNVTSRVLIAYKPGRPNQSKRIIGTLRLATKKPWAIDVSYFTPVPKALYLTAMAVAPQLQRQGIGRRMLVEAARIAREFPTTPAVQAIRLDAYDTSQPRRRASTNGAGAEGFYAKAGFREVGRVKYKGTPLVYFEMLL
jgi:ribosomal protein S18 acetylase RimI-like enzyme